MSRANWGSQGSSQYKWPLYLLIEPWRSFTLSFSLKWILSTVNGCLMSVMDEQGALAEQFQQLYTVNPQNWQLPATGLQVEDTDPPIDRGPISLEEVREAVAKLIGEKALVLILSVWRIAQSNRWGHYQQVAYALECIWKVGTISLDWKWFGCP